MNSDSATFAALGGPLTDTELLAETHRVYRRWLGDDYDLGVLDVVLCAAAAEQLTGDPPWVLIIGGSGAAKTETIVPLEGAGAHVISTISGEAALLSGTPQKDRAEDATGGLLRKIGNSGLLVIKDVTSILSMSRDARQMVLGALREIYDGRWSRDVGAEGGPTLNWSGRLVVIGACTTAWDAAHGVIAMMGDRFLLVRPRTGGRLVAGLQAMMNVSSEEEMRADLCETVGKLLTIAPGRGPQLTREENLSILGLADLITRTRTAVARSFNGQPEFAHAIGMPTRLAKQLAQLVRGGLALGMARSEAMAVAERCAADTMPPLRLLLLADVAAHKDSTTMDVTTRVQRTRMTVDRGLQELYLLGLFTRNSIAYGNERERWIYSLDEGVDRDALARLVAAGAEGPQGGSAKSGQHAEPAPPPEPAIPVLPRNGETHSGDMSPRNGKAHPGDQCQVIVPHGQDWPAHRCKRIGHATDFGWLCKIHENTARRRERRTKCAQCNAPVKADHLNDAGLCDCCAIQPALDETEMMWEST
jgi:hypothetical protein